MASVYRHQSIRYLFIKYKSSNKQVNKPIIFYIRKEEGVKTHKTQVLCQFPQMGVGDEL